MSFMSIDSIHYAMEIARNEMQFCEAAGDTQGYWLWADNLNRLQNELESRQN